MPMRPADVSISLFWDDRRKRWNIVARRQTPHAHVTLSAHSQVEIEEVALRRLASTIQLEIESWLY